MSRYRYDATSEQGTKVRGTLEASSAKVAMASLVDQGFDVASLREKKSVLQFEITRKKLDQADLLHFCRQLAAFMRAGIPLVEALDVISEETDEKALLQVLASVREGIISGDTFSKALIPFATMFPPFFIDMIRGAELSGNLDDVLDEMAIYIKREMSSRKKIKSALTYPLIVLVMAIGTVTVLAVYVLPRFKTFFESFHATLPLPTRMLLAITSFIGNWWWGIVAVTFGIGALMLIVNRTVRGRRLRDRSVLKMPVVGALIRYGIIERFCRLLATMMKAGVPLPEAMAVLATGTKNAVFQEGLAVVREAMLRGDGLARPMAASRLFPSAVVQMIRVGENTGTLDTQLGVASDYYGEELEYKIEQFTSLFEPAVIVVMGLAVGFVAVAMISAMYGIYRQVQF